MRAGAVVNDTRPMRHFGRDAVMATIAADVAARNGTIIHRHQIDERIAAAFGRIPPAEAHRP